MNESVRVTNEKTNLVVKGTVHIPINGGMIVEGYHALSFSSNIISVGLFKKFLIFCSQRLVPLIPHAFLFDKTLSISYMKSVKGTAPSQLI